MAGPKDNLPDGWRRDAGPMLEGIGPADRYVGCYPHDVETDVAGSPARVPSMICGNY